MTQLDHLSTLLQSAFGATTLTFPSAADELDRIVASLKRHISAGARINIPEDLQQEAIRRFWNEPDLETLKDGRLVSFSMCIPNQQAGMCLMEDRQLFLAVLDAKTGVDQWINDPRWYRRCYQGLIHSYFIYDDDKMHRAPAIAKQNWGDLRDYLHERTQNIVDEKVNPDWVNTAVNNRQLFSESPCAPYAAAVLSGDTTEIDLIGEQLGIAGSSWFLRELILAQVRHAVTLDHEKFKKLIPILLNILRGNPVLRDYGLILLLNKYASINQPSVNDLLRDASVEWWGNPWLPSNETRWGGVEPAARAMVSEWLKREFIEAFFTKLAQDGVGDRRRANFWLRYVKSMDNIQFALGPKALNSPDRDFRVLRQKMKGLYTSLETADSANNAFIMTLGNLVAVEFGGMGNALYGYDARKKLPFDASRSVGIARNARNPLKHDSRILWMSHQDGIRGWATWEEMFEATLKESFNIHPSESPRRTTRRANNNSRSTPPPTQQEPVERPLPTNSNVTAGNRDQNARPPQKFITAEVFAYANAQNLRAEDLRKQGGNLWVRTDDSDPKVNNFLLNCGFQYKANKGWWFK